MHIGDITKTVATIAESYGKFILWNVDQLNHVYKLVNYDVLKLLIRKAEIDKIVSASLLPFQSDPVTINLTSGTGTLPSDFYQKAKVTANGRSVDILTQMEDEERETSPVRMASTRYPTAIIYDGQIRVKPTTIANISMVYWKRPTDPVYAVTETNGILAYSPSSVQFDYNEENYSDIIRFTLEYMGIVVKNEEIIPFVQSKKIEQPV